MIECPNCGARHTSRAHFCSHCGCDLLNEDEEEMEDDEWSPSELGEEE